MEVDELNYVTV